MIKHSRIWILVATLLWAQTPFPVSAIGRAKSAASSTQFASSIRGMNPASLTAIASENGMSLQINHVIGLGQNPHVPAESPAYSFVHLNAREVAARDRLFADSVSGLLGLSANEFPIHPTPADSQSQPSSKLLATLAKTLPGTEPNMPWSELVAVARLALNGTVARRPMPPGLDEPAVTLAPDRNQHAILLVPAAEGVARSRNPSRNLLAMYQSFGARSPASIQDSWYADTLRLAASLLFGEDAFLSDEDAENHAGELALLESMSRADENVFSHMLRVGLMSGLLALNLDFDRASAQMLARQTTLHDIGKIWLLHLVRKNGVLTPAEHRAIENHTHIGQIIIAQQPGLNPKFRDSAQRIARSHHELQDGSGYPDRLQAPSIPDFVGIVTVADVFDALMGNRPYRKAMPTADAIGTMREEAGRHFARGPWQALLSILHLNPRDSRILLHGPHRHTQPKRQSKPVFQ